MSDLEHAEPMDERYYALAQEASEERLAGVLHHMRACREGGIMPIVVSP